jgi:uncharacterized membrane protein
VLLLLSFLIGIVSGLRALTAPAIVAWAAHLHWIDLHASRLSFMGSTAAVAVFTVLALGELIYDKRPSIPSRTTVIGLLPRMVFGALCGAAVAAAGVQSVGIRAALGAFGAIVGAFGGYQLRTRLVKSLKVPDVVIACLEDVVAIAGGLLIVSMV